MKRLFKILIYATGGILGLVLAPYIAFWLNLEWDMRPRSYDINDRDFRSIAVQPLESLSCGSIPADMRVTRYFQKKNFNDGDELWLLELQSTEAITELVARLQLKPAIPSEHIGRFIGLLDNKPTWVMRPHEKIKLFFIDDDHKQTDISKRCKFGIFYLWSIDVKTFFLYHIIT
ncbi:MAG: hypothetical protein WCD18_06075 [Thermosynechococcaceae cyanobacterium]